jgi:hypothetical protein
LISSSVSLAAVESDEYVWVVLEDSQISQKDESECSNRGEDWSFTDYQQCVVKLREQADNTVSEHWGLANQVVREQDTIYVQVPGRQRALTFRDDFGHPNDDYQSSYALDRYDRDRQLLYLIHKQYEAKSTIIIDLKTGFWQGLWGEKVTVSPNQRLLAGFVGTPGKHQKFEVWEKSVDGFSQDYYIESYTSDEHSEQSEAHKSYREYYKAGEAQEVFDARKITWVNDQEFYADFFYTLSRGDTAAFRVRYTFIHNDRDGKWRMSLNKVKAK